MKEFKNILVAFDESPDSVEALEVAEVFAQKSNSHLTVAYVEEQASEESIKTSPDSEPFMAAEGIAPSSITVPEEEKTKNEGQLPKEVLDKAMDTLSDDLQVTYKRLAGQPDEELNIYAVANNIDLIIIGNRGFSGIKKLIMGSVSQKVSNSAECSVFIVK